MNFARLRRLRFSLRIALIAVALLSLIFGLVGRRWQHGRRQAAGRAEVTRMGGEYRWDWDEATGSVVDKRNQWTAVTSTQPPDGATLAERVFGADFAHDVVAAYFSTGPSGLSAHLPTDGDVERLVRLLPELKALDLSFTPITDQALQHLAELAQLEWLNLYATNVSDAGLPHLNRLSKLKVLIVAETEMSVPGLARELRAPLLQEIWLSCATVRAPAGIDELVAQMPTLTVAETFQRPARGYYRRAVAGPGSAKTAD